LSVAVGVGTWGVVVGVIVGIVMHITIGLAIDITCRWCICRYYHRCVEVLLAIKRVFEKQE